MSDAVSTTNLHQARDPRYADVVEMHAVMCWDGHDQVEVIAATRELAETYIAGQWSSEGYSIKPVMVIRSLPQLRPLYIFTGRLPYDPAQEPTRQLEDFSESPGEFPGLRNGAMVSIDQVNSELSESVPYGWDVRAVGWDRDQTEAAFEERMAEARELRAARLEAFSRFTHGCVVRTTEGETLMRGTTPAGVPCWKSSSRVLYDAEIDPSTLTVIVAGPNQESDGE